MPLTAMCAGTGARGGCAGEDRTVAEAEHAAAVRADLRLHHTLVRFEPRVGPGRTETGDRAVDETGVDRRAADSSSRPHSSARPGARPTSSTSACSAMARDVGATLVGAQVAHARCPCRGSRRGSRTGIRVRSASPSGGSSFTTCAPLSASIIPASDAAMLPEPSSTTFRPSQIGAGMWPPFVRCTTAPMLEPTAVACAGSRTNERQKVAIWHAGVTDRYQLPPPTTTRCSPGASGRGAGTLRRSERRVVGQPFIRARMPSMRMSRPNSMKSCVEVWAMIASSSRYPVSDVWPAGTGTPCP